MGTPLRRLLALAAVLLLTACQATPTGRLAAANDARSDGDGSTPAQRTHLINDGWRFIRGDRPEAVASSFDDSAWQTVTLPHTWNIVDGADGGNNYYRGAGWYRRALRVQGADLRAGKRFYLRFGAASLVADVHVNGTHVGQHRGGFAAFCFDVTDELQDGDNSLAVRVDNSRQQDIAPISGDFTVFGGLYRDVELLVLDPLHISPMDDGSRGIYVDVKGIWPERALIDIRLRVRNSTRQPKRDQRVAVLVHPFTERISVYQMQTASETFDLDADSEREVVVPITIRNPRIWSGANDANRYQLSIAFNGEALTTGVGQTFALRTISIDPERGLLLNGEPYPMRGVNTHQEVGGKGWAGSREDYERMYGLVRDMGANSVRMAHYQHGQDELDICDRLGLLVWAEIPFVNEFGRDVPGFDENLKQQLRELIKQNYNHPSIVTWGLLNEVMLKDDDPRWKLLSELQAIAHELDPARPTTIAQNTRPDHGSLKTSDVIAFNRYTGWYGGNADAFGKTVDADHAANPYKPVAISEYGAGGSIHQHELNPARVEPGGPWHPEEYQCHFHEQAWFAMKERPWLWGTFIWNMFDFGADHRREGDLPGRNDKGMVTFDQQTKKDVYFFYQAQWTTRPMVHITSRRFDPYPVGPSDVKVYSNCDEVELIQNGTSLGTQRSANGIFIFKDVPFEPGETTTIARGKRDDRIVEDKVVRTVSRQASTRTTAPPNG